MMKENQFCVEFIYCTPFENSSGIIDSDGVLIK